MRKLPHVKSLLSLLRGKRRADPQAVEADGMPNIAEHVTDAGYYQEVSFRYSSAQVVCIMLLAVFLAVSLMTNASLLSADNFIYFVKDLANSVSLRESEAKDTMVFSADENNQHALYRDGLAVLGQQKLTVFTATGREAHSHLLSYRHPRLASSGRYLAAYDLGGKSVSLYNSFTCVKEITTEYAVRFVEACNKGYYCVITDGAEYASEVVLYDESHRRINRYRLEEYTLCADIKEDASEMMLVSVSAEQGRMTTHVAFAVPGKSEWSRRFAVSDAYPVACHYTDEGNILLLTTDSLRLYSADGELLNTQLLGEADIRSFRVDENGCVLIARANAYDATARVMAFDKTANQVYNVLVEDPLYDACYLNGTLALLGEKKLIVYQNHSNDDVTELTFQGTYHKVLAYEDGGELLLCGDAKAIVVKPD